MLCDKPFMVGNVPFGCGQCLPCRVNRRRQWMWRQYLESLCHDENCFVTLTYNEKHLPKDGSLEKDVVSVWIRSLRDAIRPKRIRYFVVGEYGEKTYRPHYHATLFGVSWLSKIPRGSDYETFATTVDRCWGKGFTSVAEFNELTAQYVAGYVVKKLGDQKDELLQGRVPEFARMSNRPGIGAGAVCKIAERIRADSPAVWRAILNGERDVPKVLEIGRRTIPLGRYLLRKLRESVGLSEDQIREIRGSAVYEKSIEMQSLLQDTFPDARVLTSREAYLKSSYGKRLRSHKMSELRRKRGTI